MRVMAEFAAAIATRRQPLTDGAAGLRVLRVLEAASESAERGGDRVPVPGPAGLPMTVNQVALALLVRAMTRKSRPSDFAGTSAAGTSTSGSAWSTGARNSTSAATSSRSPSELVA